MDRVLHLSSCRAAIELKDRAPLTESEINHFLGMIPECGLKGQQFDEVAYLYPFQIPKAPKVTVLAEVPRVVSVLGKFDRDTLIGIQGDEELEKVYCANPGAFLYVVGVMSKRVKDGRQFWNIRPRCWVIVQVDASKIQKGEELMKKRKNG
jgi:hypothetical protein